MCALLATRASSPLRAPSFTPARSCHSAHQRLPTMLPDSACLANLHRSWQVRCLVDYPGEKLPSVTSGELEWYLLDTVAPQVSCLGRVMMMFEAF